MVYVRENVLARDETIFSKNNKNIMEKQERVQINSTKKYAKFKTVPPPVKQGEQWFIDDSFKGEKGTVEGKVAFRFHH